MAQKNDRGRGRGDRFAQKRSQAEIKFVARPEIAPGRADGERPPHGRAVRLFD